ncbi:MAG: hypothetical protein P9L99_03080 [Candidatus Lernaella stagnicola]|nr:hypothetical protein [Candidatus Lernaella stagnicola]
MKRFFLILILVAFLGGCATPLARINGNAPTKPVFLSVVPEDAKVFLDGMYVGRAKRFTEERGGLPLTAGAHRLRLEAEEFLNESIVLTAEQGTQKIEIRMLPRPVPPPESEG